MRAELRLGRVARFKRSDGDPALAAHRGRDRGVGIERHEQATAIHAAEPGRDDRIGIEREADRCFFRAILVDDRIAAAAPDLAAHTLGEDREAEPTLKFEAMAL